MQRRYSVFTRLAGDLPNVIQCAVVEPDERAAMPWVASALLPFKEKDNGLPMDGELQRVEKIEDRLMAVLKDSGILHVGHVTGSGTMRVFFYGRAQGPHSVPVKTGLLKKDEIALDWRHDPEWALYEMELQPTAEEAMHDRFRFLWQKLAEHGDNPEIPREVDFGVVFESADQRTAFIAEVGSRGFMVRNESLRVDDNGMLWCNVYKLVAIAPNEIVPECLYIDEAGRRHGGEFDGWACHVTT